MHTVRQVLVVQYTEEHPGRYAPNDEAWVVLGQAESLPVDVASGIFYEPEEVLEETTLVSAINVLLALAELLQLPVELLADRSVDHFQSLELVWCVIVDVVVAVYALAWVLRRSATDPSIVRLHLILKGRHQ